jgi:hypothetical protein
VLDAKRLAAGDVDAVLFNDTHIIPQHFVVSSNHPVAFSTRRSCPFLAKKAREKRDLSRRIFDLLSKRHRLQALRGLKMMGKRCDHGLNHQLLVRAGKYRPNYQLR